MKTLRLFRLELGQLFRNRLALLVFGLTALSPVVWLLLYKMLGTALSDTITTTMNNLYIAYPAIVGGIAGAVLFAVLTIMQLDAPHKFQVTAITDAMVSPLTQALVRLLALLSAAVVTQAAAILLWLPYTMYRVGAVFDGSVYLLAYLVLMLPSLLLAVLFSASMYQFTRRADLSLVAFLIFAALSLIVWPGDWQLCWLNPVLSALSDDFSNVRVFRTIGYARLTWLLALSGLYVVSYLCVRQYGKGVLGSLSRGVRRVYRPAIAALLLVSAGLAYAEQPFYDQSSPDLSQNMLDVDYDDDLTLSRQYADVVPDPKTGSLCVVGLCWGFYVHLFHWTGFSELLAPLLLTLLPAVIFCLGLGWALGGIHPALVYVLMAAVFLLSWAPLPHALGFSLGSFFADYPQTLGVLDPVFSVPAPVLCGCTAYLLAGGAAFLWSQGRQK